MDGKEPMGGKAPRRASRVAVAPTIWSLGTSDRSLRAFLACLRAAGVTRIADVRRYPTSERHPQFGRERLRAAVREEAIDYVAMSETLGGFRRGGYARFRRTEAFEEGLRTLERLARERPTCLLCAERMPSRCHRLEISRELEGRGWRVVHILDEDTIWSVEEGPRPAREEAP